MTIINILPSVKLTASSHLKIDGWKMIHSLLGPCLFSGVNLLLVSGSVVHNKVSLQTTSYEVPTGVSPQKKQAVELVANGPITLPGGIWTNWCHSCHTVDERNPADQLKW